MGLGEVRFAVKEFSEVSGGRPYIRARIPLSALGLQQYDHL